MDDAVDDRGGEFVVGKDGAPFAEFDVGGEDDTASFIGAGDDLVEQAGAVDVEGHVAEFIEDDQIGAGQVLEDLIETAGAFGLAQLQDEFGGLAETHGASLPDGFDAQGDGQMGLASSGASVEDVFCFNVFSAGSSVFFRSVGGWFSPVSSSCSQ